MRGQQKRNITHISTGMKRKRRTAVPPGSLIKVRGLIHYLVEQEVRFPSDSDRLADVAACLDREKAEVARVFMDASMIARIGPPLWHLYPDAKPGRRVSEK